MSPTLTPKSSYFGAPLLALTFSFAGCGREESRESLAKAAPTKAGAENASQNASSTNAATAESVQVSNSPSTPQEVRTKPTSDLTDKYAEMRTRLRAFLDDAAGPVPLLSFAFQGLETTYQTAFRDFHGPEADKVRQEVLEKFQKERVANLLDHLPEDQAKHIQESGLGEFLGKLQKFEFEIARGLAFSLPDSDPCFIQRKLSQRDREALAPFVAELKLFVGEVKSRLAKEYLNISKDRELAKEIAEKHNLNFVGMSDFVWNRLLKFMALSTADGVSHQYYYIPGAKPSGKIAKDIAAWDKLLAGTTGFIGRHLAGKALLTDDFDQIERIYRLSYLNQETSIREATLAREAWVTSALTQKTKTLPTISASLAAAPDALPLKIGSLNGSTLELALRLGTGKPLPSNISKEQLVALGLLSQRVEAMFADVAAKVYRRPWSEQIFSESLTEAGRNYAIFTDTDLGRDLRNRLRAELSTRYAQGFFGGPYRRQNDGALPSAEAQDVELFAEVEKIFSKQLSEHELPLSEAQALIGQVVGTQAKERSNQELLEQARKRLPFFTTQGLKNTYLRMEIMTPYGGGSYDIHFSPCSAEALADANDFDQVVKEFNERLSTPEYFGAGEKTAPPQRMLSEDFERVVAAFCQEKNFSADQQREVAETVATIRNGAVGGEIAMYTPGYNANDRFCGYRYASLDLALRFLDATERPIGYYSNLLDWEEETFEPGAAPDARNLKIFRTQKAGQPSPYDRLINLFRDVRQEYTKKVIALAQPRASFTQENARELLYQVLKAKGLVTDSADKAEVLHGLDLVLGAFANQMK